MRSPDEVEAEHKAFMRKLRADRRAEADARSTVYVRPDGQYRVRELHNHKEGHRYCVQYRQPRGIYTWYCYAISIDDGVAITNIATRPEGGTDPAWREYVGAPSPLK